MNLAEELKQKSFENFYSQMIEVIKNDAEHGETKSVFSYKFFKGNNEILKYVLERLPAEGFVLRLYETRLEVRWG